MTGIIQREAIYLWYYFSIQFHQIVPYWGFGIAVGSLVSVFLKGYIQHLMSSMQARGMGIGGILLASALGILSPLCLYGTVPIVASFAKSGMREDWLASFMMSSILLNPQLFLFSFALGQELALLRLFLCFLGGCAAGLVVRLCFSKKPFYTFTAFDLPENRDTDPNLLLRVMKNLWRNIKVTAPYFVLGMALTALYQRYVPSEWVAGLFGPNQGLGTLMAVALGIPLYTCGGGTIPLLAAWLGQGMSWGSAVAFMLIGPATKLTNLGALKIVLGGRNFFCYIIFSILLATVFGLAVNLIF